MDKQRCALCGTDQGNFHPRHYVTVDVVADREGDMLGGLEKHHTLYFCDQCSGKGETKNSVSTSLLVGCYAIVISGLGLLLLKWVSQQTQIGAGWLLIPWGVLINLPGILVWWYFRRRQRQKIMRLVAAHHGSPGGRVRVFNQEDFEALQNKRK